MPALSALPFSYPTTIVLVDDDESFLKHMTMALFRQGLMKTHHLPQSALGDMKENEQLLADFVPAAGNLPGLDDPRRFDLFSVLITDYEMGAMSGEELCEQLGSNPVGRIMLTGKVDERHAVRVFNQDAIDRYVRKDDPLVIEHLQSFIDELKVRFFSRLASTVPDDLVQRRNPFLYDPVFGIYLERSLKENGIVEYYLGHTFPGYLMVDADGELLAFVVLSERQMAEHVEAAENAGAPAELLELLRSGRVVPFFPTDDNLYSSEFAGSWKEWTFTADLIEGKKRYYHAVVSGPAARGIFPGRSVYSYNRFLQDRVS